MSSLAMSDYDTFESDRGAPTGRHALSEDAVLTPIFHALARGGPRGRRPEPAAAASSDPVETFRRNPLTAPIPIQALQAVPARPTRTGRRALVEPPPAAPVGSGRRRVGRHHRRLEVVGY